MNQSFKVPSKRLSYAQEADGYLEVLKSDLCLSRRQRFISIGVYDELLTTIFNISKNINSYIKYEVFYYSIGIYFFSGNSFFSSFLGISIVSVPFLNLALISFSVTFSPT